MGKIQSLLIWVLLFVCGVGVGCSESPSSNGKNGMPNLNGGNGQAQTVPPLNNPPSNPETPPPTTPPATPPPVTPLPPVTPPPTTPPATPPPPTTPPPEPPPQTPPPITCPGQWDEEFEVESVRFRFYTARRGDGGTKNPVVVTTLGKEEAKLDIHLQHYQEYEPGKTEPGLIYKARLDFDEAAHHTSSEFRKMQIGLEPLLFNNHPWFLGGILVEGLKKGCAYQRDDHWTNFYFNPFVRTWIDVDHPLIIDPDDALAIFEIHMGNKDDAGSDDDFYGSTPFENGDDTRILNTPMLDYEDTDDFEATRTYYYGHTYFAVPQSGAKQVRLSGKYSDLSGLSEKTNWGFQIALKGGDGAYFDLVQAYLIKPIFQATPTSPFWGFKASRPNFSIDYCGSFWSCGGIGKEILINEKQYEIEIKNFGEGPSDATALGFLNWAIQYDNPGDNMVTGGWGW